MKDIGTIINELKPNQFKTNPLMLTAWPGMANAGIMTTEFIRDQLHMKPFAFLDMKTLYTPTSLSVEKGKLQPPELPKSGFFFHFNPDMIVFESDVQLEGKEGMFMLHTILETARHFNVSHILTLAGLPRAESHKSEPSIFCACNGDPMIEDLKKYNIQPVEKGFIAGPSGLLPGLASALNIKAGCLLATVPAYAGLNWYPKASLQLLRKLSEMYSITLDLSTLEQIVTKSESMFEGIESQFEEQFPGVIRPRELPDKHTLNELLDQKEDIPGHIIIKIEELFKAATHDRKRAIELKEELDRWELYGKYENRFLDLFKDNKPD